MTILSLFDGIGGARQALENIGFTENTARFFISEINPHCLSVTEFQYPDQTLMGDVRTLETGSLPEIDLLIGGSPCFTGDSLVTTSKGLKVIKEVSVGDLVLTHANRFKKVVEVMSRMSTDVYKVKMEGCLPITTTKNHLFLTRTMKRKWNQERRSYDRVFSDPEWKRIEEVKKDDFCGIAINREKENPLNLSDEDCWILGRYVADGYLNVSKRKGRKNSFNHWVVLCVGKRKIESVKEKIRGYHAYYREEKTAYKVRIVEKRLSELCGACGRGAANKVVPSFVLNLPPALLEIFLEGYISGDGSLSKTGFYTASSASKNLIVQLTQVVAKIYGTMSSITHYKRTPTCVIEGRTVRQKDSYHIKFKKSPSKQDNYKLIDDIIWVRYRKSEKFALSVPVYNLEVEEDNSYVVANCIVHNCLNLSVAKRQGERGINAGESALFWEYVRIKKEISPKFFLLENVASMESKDREVITSELEVTPVEIYSGIFTPQARKRLYWTNIPKNPLPKDRELVVKDILEEDSHALDRYFMPTTYTYNYSKENLPYPYANGPIKIGQLDAGGQGGRIYSLYGKSVCLTANGGGGGAKTGLYKFYDVPDNTRSVRRLTPVECERLQGFKDNHTRYGKDLKTGKIIEHSVTQRCRMLGNSFTVPVIEHLLKPLKSLLCQ